MMKSLLTSLVLIFSSFLYSQNYYVKQQRGFTDAELENAFSFVAGTSAKTIFQQLVYGTVIPDYAGLLREVGYEWTDVNQGKTIPFQDQA